MKLKPSAILFDMDGVLVDSLDSWWISFNEALKKYDQKEISRREFIEKYWGHDLQYNLEEMGLDLKILKFDIDVEGHLKIILNNTASLYPKTVIITKIFQYATNVMYATLIIRNLSLLGSLILFIFGFVENYEVFDKIFKKE